MYRKEIIALLKEQSSTVTELARRFEVRPRDIEEELEHVRKSIKTCSIVTSSTNPGNAPSANPPGSRNRSYVLDRQRFTT